MLQLSAWLTATVLTVSQKTVAYGRSRSTARGATLLEYILIIAVIIGVLAIFSTGFRNAVSGLIERITGFISSESA